MKLTKGDQVIRSIEDWLALAPPKGRDRHWQDGRSAKECANAWLETGKPAIPTELTALLESHPKTKGLVIETAEPEIQIRFDGRRGEPRNADIAFCGRAEAGLLAGTIEAKADETFGELLPDVLSDSLERWRTSEQSAGIDRVKDLVKALLPPQTPGLPQAKSIRYQLLTAVAGTLAWAAALRVATAVLLIHEFHTAKTDSRKLAANAADFDAFVLRLSGGTVRSVPNGQIIGPIRVPGGLAFPAPADLYIGKAVRKCAPNG